MFHSIVISWRRNFFLTVMLLLIAASPIVADIIKTTEAEKSEVTCAVGAVMGRTLWASGGGRTPDFWGREPGDAVSWTVHLGQYDLEQRLAIRYSYHHSHYAGFAGAANPERNLELIIENITPPSAEYQPPRSPDSPMPALPTANKPLHITVPDTGSWDEFRTSHVNLPFLDRGDYRFTLRSPAPHTVTNLDCMTLYTGASGDLPAPLLSNRIGQSPSRRFELYMTANAWIPFTPAELYAHFDRIYDHYRGAMGWAPPAPVRIHIIESALWDNPGATSYQNQWGVFFPDGSAAADIGNWMHEMTHMFYCAHFPRWFDEASVRTLTTFDWEPSLFLQQPPENYAYYSACADQGRDVLANPDMRFDSPDPILYALRVEFGPDLFPKFFHACLAASRRGELDFTPGRHLTNAEIARYLSEAAGADVTPILRQWSGFQ